jgi:ubiquinone/menaquinone biosynthesis C-methylase UbiE
MQTATDQQKAVEKFWDQRPCGSDQSGRPAATRDYFLEIEGHRYKYQGHIRQILSKINWRGKKVLEIGTGVGTDARELITRGAIYEGINVDQGSVDLTAKAFEVFRLSAGVRRCSATAMDYDDSSFDAVYSFGVLHHIPEVDRAVAEIYRVLRPGGEVLVMVYNKTSINYYVEIMFLRKIALRLLVFPPLLWGLAMIGFPKEKLERHRELYRTSKRASNQEWLSRNTDGPDNPYSRVYNAEEAARLFEQFEVLANEVYFFDRQHWGPLSKLMPESMARWLGARWGWHRVIHARKPGRDTPCLN